VKQGFGQLHADMEARKYQSASLHQEKLALAHRQLYANRRIAQAIEKTHQESLAQRAQQTELLRRNIQSQGERIVNAQSLTCYCPDCAPVLDTVQQIAQGKAPLDIIVEATERQLAKDCPECGEVLETIIPIAQGEVKMPISDELMGTLAKIL
jgi:shikimate 5-dehydrogenase